MTVQKIQVSGKRIRLFVCPLAWLFLRNHVAELHQIFCMCVVVAQSSSRDITISYVITSGFVGDVTFSHSGPRGALYVFPSGDRIV